MASASKNSTMRGYAIVKGKGSPARDTLIQDGYGVWVFGAPAENAHTLCVVCVCVPSTVFAELFQEMPYAPAFSLPV